METQNNAKGEKVTLYYGRYAFKNHNIPEDKLLYEGHCDTCPKTLLEGIKVTEKHKYTRVWKS